MSEKPPFGVTMDSGHPIKGVALPPTEPAGQPDPGKARLSINLHPPSVEALAVLCEKTGLTQTDIVNRAIQIYGFIHEQQRYGTAVILRDREGSHERVRFV